MYVSGLKGEGILWMLHQLLHVQNLYLAHMETNGNSKILEAPPLIGRLTHCTTLKLIQILPTYI